MWSDISFWKLIAATKHCKLRFEDRLVYSLLVYRSIKHSDEPLSRRALARRLLLNRETVGLCVKRLAANHLVDPATLQPRPPDETSQSWFGRLPAVKDKWQDQFSYLLIPRVRKMPPGCTWRTIVIWSFLQRSELPARSYSRPEIGRILRMDSATVKKHISILCDHRMVVLKGHAVVEVFETDEKSMKRYFWLKRPKQSAPPAGSTLTEGQKWAAVACARTQGQGLLLEMFHFGKFTEPELDWVRETAREQGVDPGMLGRVYRESKKAHEDSQRQGRFLGLNCFRLFKYKLMHSLRGPAASRTGRPG